MNIEMIYRGRKFDKAKKNKILSKEKLHKITNN